MLFFVYGTLMSGYGNNRLLQTSTLISKDTIRGSLYEICAFPGWRSHGNGIVRGEVYRVDDERVIDNLNRLEGFISEGNENNFYNRVQIETLSNTYQEPVYAYEWNENLENENKYKYKKIYSGDFRLNNDTLYNKTELIVENNKHESFRAIPDSRVW